jgi:hypothetical protein
MILGSRESYETAYRCLAYAMAIYPITAILGMIPYLGVIIGVAWGTYLMVMASIEVHGIESRKAYIVFGIIGGLLMLLQLTGEYSARQMQSRMEHVSEGMQEQLKKMEEMSPEEAGKMVGEFLKGMEEAQKKQQQ